MANPFSNKKKIRGWKRRIKQIEQWKQRHIDLNIEQLCRNNRDYVKLWIDPFYRLTRRNPPMWYSRLIFRAMIEVYSSWYQGLKQLNEPFYLKVWLHHPHFINSQIVVAFRECLDFYNKTFDKSNENKSFPTGLCEGTLPLSHFDWALHIDSDQYLLSELQEDLNLGYRTQKDIECIKKKAYKIDSINLSGIFDTVFNVKVGHVWVGEMKRSN